METETIRWERDGAIVVLTFDDPNQSANTMNDDYLASMDRTICRLEEERATIAGVILASAKKTFFAGGDLRELKGIRAENADYFTARVRRIKDHLRRLETLGIPVVTVLAGAALGGGLEIALATHHRIAVDRRGVVFGFPEVTLGLLPGAGGVVRGVRLLGVVPALAEALLEGRGLSPAAARELGIVDEVVGEIDELMPAARAWIAANPGAVQPWDADGYSIPGGLPDGLDPVVDALPAELARRLRAGNYPALPQIASAAVEAARAEIGEAFEIEGRHFIELACGQTAKNMIQAVFFDTQEVSGRARRARASTPVPSRVLVVGAGAIGAGVSYACAAAGLSVVLLDLSPELAERGKQRLGRLAYEAARRGTADPALLDRITATADPAAAAEAELLVEAVFEDAAVKADAYASVRAYLAPDVLLASTTSTLSITELATNLDHPEDFVGLHFPGPVEATPLLEVVRGGQSSETALTRALAFGALIGKTPIVVKDSPGFFAGRLASRFSAEADAMSSEGVSARAIESASIGAGFPAPSDGEAGSIGEASPLPNDIAERLLFIPALEAVSCVEEGVIESAAEANVGSILGIGFPGWTGGALQYVDGYSGSAGGFVARAQALAETYGPLFQPPASLLAAADGGNGYRETLEAKAARW
jgi:3-hydroxyacyl-CoA dehydrogenase/enoyl-CoA hydratase/3-hydroxybutyryl-CoA epimerase